MKLVRQLQAAASRRRGDRRHRSQRDRPRHPNRLIGWTMTREPLGIAESDLIDGVEFGGVATFLGEAQESGTTLIV